MDTAEGWRRVVAQITTFRHSHEISSFVFSGNLQFLNPVTQCRRLEAKQLGRTALAADPPSRSCQNLQDMPAFRLLEGDEFRILREVRDRWLDMQHPAVAHDYSTLDDIPQFADIPRP